MTASLFFDSGNKLLLNPNGPAGSLMHDETCCCEECDPACACGSAIDACADCPTYKFTVSLICVGGTEVYYIYARAGVPTNTGYGNTTPGVPWVPVYTPELGGVCVYYGGGVNGQENPSGAELIQIYMACCDGKWLIAVRKWSGSQYANWAMFIKETGGSPVGTYSREFLKTWNYDVIPYITGLAMPTCITTTYKHVYEKDTYESEDGQCQWKVTIEVAHPDLTCECNHISKTSQNPFMIVGDGNPYWDCMVTNGIVVPLIGIPAEPIPFVGYNASTKTWNWLYTQYFPDGYTCIGGDLEHEYLHNVPYYDLQLTCHNGEQWVLDIAVWAGVCPGDVICGPTTTASIDVTDILTLIGDKFHLSLTGGNAAQLHRCGGASTCLMEFEL